MSRPRRAPSYRKHKASGQAVVTIDGRDVYLCLHHIEASYREYDRVLAEWLANGWHLPDAGGPMVGEIIAAFAEHIEQRYADNHAQAMKSALSYVRRLYETHDVADFGPLALRTLQEQMVKGRLARSTINKHTSTIKMMFK